MCFTHYLLITCDGGWVFILLHDTHLPFPHPSTITIFGGKNQLIMFIAFLWKVCLLPHQISCTSFCIAFYFP